MHQLPQPRAQVQIRGGGGGIWVTATVATADFNYQPHSCMYVGEAKQIPYTVVSLFGVCER